MCVNRKTKAFKREKRSRHCQARSFLASGLKSKGVLSLQLHFILWTCFSYLCFFWLRLLALFSLPRGFSFLTVHCTYTKHRAKSLSNNSSHSYAYGCVFRVNGGSQGIVFATKSLIPIFSRCIW